jgi:hypothetical protein
MTILTCTLSLPFLGTDRREEVGRIHVSYSVGLGFNPRLGNRLSLVLYSVYYSSLSPGTYQDNALNCIISSSLFITHYSSYDSTLRTELHESSSYEQ